MKFFKYFLVVGMLFSTVAQAVIEDLVKRENLEGINVVYADWDTYNFFEKEVQWGARVYWGGIDNPFTNGKMPLKDFLETFGLLIPKGGTDGVACTELYRAGTELATGNLIKKYCTVTYKVGVSDEWILHMLVDHEWAGNAYEVDTIMPNQNVALEVKKSSK